MKNKTKAKFTQDIKITLDKPAKKKKAKKKA
jgi:hypothetical protein